MEQELGEVVHYFGHAGAAVIKFAKGGLKVGETIKFVKQGQELFSQKVESMQVERKDIKEVKKGEEAAIKVSEKVRPGFLVFKITE